MSPRANNTEGEAVVNDSPADCQSRRADRSIFSAEKIQDRWFKSFSRNQKRKQSPLRWLFSFFIMKERFQSIDTKVYEPDWANNSKGDVATDASGG